MGRQLPASVTNALRALAAVLAVSGVVAALLVALREELVLTWAEGNQAASEILQQGGLAALAESDIHVPAFVPVALVMFLVFLMLCGVLALFFRSGHQWARVLLVVLMLFTALGWVAWLRTGPPPVFSVLAIVSIGLDLLLVLFLAHPDTGAFVRGSWLATHSQERRRATDGG